MLLLAYYDGFLCKVVFFILQNLCAPEKIRWALTSTEAADPYFSVQDTTRLNSKHNNKKQATIEYYNDLVNSLCTWEFLSLCIYCL